MDVTRVKSADTSLEEHEREATLFSIGSRRDLGGRICGTVCGPGGAGGRAGSA
jgi:hypothetical protein